LVSLFGADVHLPMYCCRNVDVFRLPVFPASSYVDIVPQGRQKSSTKNNTQASPIKSTMQESSRTSVTVEGPSTEEASHEPSTSSGQDTVLEDQSAAQSSTVTEDQDSVAVEALGVASTEIQGEIAKLEQLGITVENNVSSSWGVHVISE